MNGRTIFMASISVALLGIFPVSFFAQTATPVNVTEDNSSFTLTNGIVTARILKSSGDIQSLRYKGTEILTDKSGHGGGYWSHDTTGGKTVVTKITIVPSANGGERAEVSIKGI